MTPYLLNNLMVALTATALSSFCAADASLRCSWAQRVDSALANCGILGGASDAESPRNFRPKNCAAGHALAVVSAVNVRAQGLCRVFAWTGRDPGSE